MIPILAEDVPPECHPSVDVDIGGVIYYVDKNLEIRPFYGYQGHQRFVSGFVVPHVDEAMFEFLIQTLLANDPLAQVIRHLKTPKGFLLCSVKDNMSVADFRPRGPRP